MLRFSKPPRPGKKAGIWQGISIAAVMLLFVALVLNLCISTSTVNAQTPPDQATPEVSETTTPQETASTTTPSVSTTEEASGNKAPAVPTLPASAVNPAQAAQVMNENLPNDQAAEDAMDVAADLSPDQVNQLKEIAAGALTPETLEQIKKLASDKIEELGPTLIQKLDDKATQKQEQRLFWIGILLIVVLPVATFLLFMLYPLVRRKSFSQRVPNVKLGKIYGLYLPQAVLVTIVMLLLGGALWGVQFLTGRVLGGVTNPQLVLQREAINYVIDDRENLINNYTDIFVGVADDIKNEDPEKSIFDIILENALQIKENPLVNTTVHIVQFIMPFLNYMSLVTMGLLVLFFLLRIRPEIASLLTYPVEILIAESTTAPPPPFRSVALGEVEVDQANSTSMRKIGQKLMWNEIKVVALFALAVLVVAFVMSLILPIFFSQTSYLLVGSISDAIEYFLRVEGAANTLIITVVILMVFLVETIAIFLLSFVFLLGKLQDALRQRMAGRITWKQTGQYMGRQGLRFAWILVVATIFGLGSPYLADNITNALYNGDKDPNWTVALLVVPVMLLVLLNLGMWLLRGFKMFVKLFKSSVAVEYGFKKAKTKQAELVTAGK